jgi:hypothetical protein
MVRFVRKIDLELRIIALREQMEKIRDEAAGGGYLPKKVVDLAISALRNDDEAA